MIVFTVLLLILSFSSCGTQGDRIYYSNSYDNGTLYSMNTDGSDNRKLNDNLCQMFQYPFLLSEYTKYFLILKELTYKWK